MNTVIRIKGNNNDKECEKETVIQVLGRMIGVNILFPYYTMSLSSIIILIYYLNLNTDSYKFQLPLSVKSIYQIFTNIFVHVNNEHFVCNIVAFVPYALYTELKYRYKVLGIFLFGSIGSNIIYAIILFYIAHVENSELHSSITGSSGGIFVLYSFFTLDIIFNNKNKFESYLDRFSFSVRFILFICSIFTIISSFIKIGTIQDSSLNIAYNVHYAGLFIGVVFFLIFVNIRIFYFLSIFICYIVYVIFPILIFIRC